MKTILFLGACALIGCTDTVAPIKGTQSLRVDLVTPTSGGSEAQRLPPTVQAIIRHRP